MKIVFFGDLHFPYSKILNDKLLKVRDDFYFPFFQKVFELDGDIFISLGDLVLKGYKEEMDEVYMHVKNKKPFFHVLGNHDTTCYELDELVDNKFIFHDTFLEFNKCCIIILQSPRYKDSENYGGFLSPLQLSWLENSIKKSEDKPLLIFSHHPVFDTVRKSNYPMFCIDKECNVYDVLKTKKQNSFFINGHNHSDSITKKDNWTFISTNCIIDAKSVKIVEITKKFLEYKTIDFSTEEDKKLAKILVENVDGIKFSKYSIGTTLEKNGKFSLE